MAIIRSRNMDNTVALIYRNERDLQSRTPEIRGSRIIGITVHPRFQQARKPNNDYRSPLANEEQWGHTRAQGFGISPTILIKSLPVR